MSASKPSFDKTSSHPPTQFKLGFRPRNLSSSANRRSSGRTSGSAFGSAYTSVAARRSLGAPQFVKATATPPPPPPQSPPKAKKIDWPQPVREYVQRSFAGENAIPGITNDEMQTRLKKVINEAAEENALFRVDWANLPLPQQMIHREKIEAFTPQKPVMTQPSTPPKIQMVHEQPSQTPPTNKKDSRKRKSSEMASDPEPRTDTVTPPWKKKDQALQNAFEDRITYPEFTTPKDTHSKRNEKRARKNHEQLPLDESSISSSSLEKRRQRFHLGRVDTPSPLAGSSKEDSPMPDAAQGPVVGTCQDLEKKYFRLTSAPKPETVRPLPVLEKTLEFLKEKWRRDQNYYYICDQFKSLRQDLTVQHIKTEFTVNVYELHARIALERGDLGEYNQCQTQLRALYKQNLGGHPAEFLAYRILYFIYTCNRVDMNDVLADLSLTDREEPAVKHALEVRSALALGNYHRFFKLFHMTPNMGGYLMDMFIVRERLAALATMSKSFKQTIALSHVSEELGFTNDPDCAQFIAEHGGEALLEQTEEDLYFASAKAGTLFESAKSTAFRRVDIKGQI